MTEKKSSNVIFLASPILLSLLLTFGCATLEPAEKIIEVEGTWIGSPIENPQGNCILIFSKNRAVAGLPGGWFRGIFQLNTTTSPKQMDIMIQQCYPPEYAGKTSLAIYQLNGNILTLAGPEPGVPTRPTSFQQQQGTSILVLTKQ